MSKSYVVVFVEPDDLGGIDGASAEVFMRFTEKPTDEFLSRLAATRPTERVYCLLGADTWHAETDR